MPRAAQGPPRLVLNSIFAAADHAGKDSASEAGKWRLSAHDTLAAGLGFTSPRRSISASRLSQNAGGSI
jgi:hypothetical protein